jgi:hypothetical protein
MPVKIKRSQAAEVINRIREIIVLEREHRRVFTEALASPVGVQIEEYLKTQGIDPLRVCEGEAHRNAYIDHCGVCMPRWGIAGPDVKVS